MIAISIITGAANDHLRITLKDAVTYIGTKESAAIKLKGFLAPELAGAITRRREGFVLKALKPGYIKVNGIPLKDHILLENGARLEMGSAIMVFVKID